MAEEETGKSAIERLRERIYERGKEVTGERSEYSGREFSVPKV